MFSQDSTSLSLCFLGLNVLCLYVFLDSMSSVFMFHKTQHPLSLYFHRTQCPSSLCFIRLNVLYLYVFIGLNVLRLYVSLDSTSSVFMFYRTQRPPSLCFIGLNVLCLNVSIGLNILCLYIFIGLNVLSLYIFVGLSVLCLYDSWDSTSSVFMFSQDTTSSALCFIELKVICFLFHETRFSTLSLNSKFFYLVGTSNSFFSKDSSFTCCDPSKNYPNIISVFVFTYLLLLI